MFRPACVGLVSLLFVSAAGAAPPSLADLTPAQRQRIDQLAAAFPIDDAREQVFNFADNPAAWMIVHVTLSPEEEADAAKKAHAQVLDQFKAADTPKDVEQVFQKLVAALPDHCKADPIRFSLTVLEAEGPAAFSVGGGRIYVTRPLLDSLLSDKERGRGAVAFVLANEIGHVVRHHCRRGYQLLLIQKEINEGVGVAIKETVLHGVLKTQLAPEGAPAKFVYASFQEDEADLFGVQLCRNAGFDLDQVVDALRWAVAVEHPRILTDPKYVPEAKADRSAAPFYLTSHPPALRRLKKLNLERTGGVEDEAKFGLFVYDRTTAKLTKAGDGLVGQGEKSVVFVHGLHGDEISFANMLAAAGKSDDLKGCKLLFFRFPSNTSLARCGELLANEMARVVRSPEKASFIGHSAGGLVTRYYVEKKGGAFDRAVFVATPHAGSAMTRLKYLLDASVFFERVFKLDLLQATAESIKEGLGEMGYDLEPDSLFLRDLDAEPKAAGRYTCFYGKVQGKGGVGVNALAALSTSLTFTRPTLKRQFTMSVKSDILKALIREGVDQLVVPRELLDGDLVVTTSSAKLRGAKEAIETDLDHVAIVRDEKVIEKVLGIVSGK